MNQRRMNYPREEGEMQVEASNDNLRQNPPSRYLKSNYLGYDCGHAWEVSQLKCDWIRIWVEVFPDPVGHVSSPTQDYSIIF